VFGRLASKTGHWNLKSAMIEAPSERPILLVLQTLPEQPQKEESEQEHDQMQTQLCSFRSYWSATNLTPSESG
jgi:hypothetical protein